MQHSTLKPYLLGQQQLPQCSNCRVDTLWSHFCQYKSHGPVCPQWDQDHLMDALMGRWAAAACFADTSPSEIEIISTLLEPLLRLMAGCMCCMQ
jgi:hypothetical protein